MKKFNVADAETWNANIGQFNNVDEAIECANDNKEGNIHFEVYDDEDSTIYYSTQHGYLPAYYEL